MAEPAPDTNHRRVTEQIGGVLIGLGGGVLIAVIRGPAGVLMGLALLLAGTVMFVAPAWPWMLPVRVERDMRGSLLRFQRPRLSNKLATKALRAETLQLVKEMHAYLRDHPDPPHQFRPMNLTEEEQENAWIADRMADEVRRNAEAQEIAELFAGRARYLLAEYARRGMITEADVEKIEWTLNTKYWLGQEAARTLEALARQLR